MLLAACATISPREQAARADEENNLKTGANECASSWVSQNDDKVSDARTVAQAAYSICGNKFNQWFSNF
jgi:hypothetical protein